MTAPVRVVDLRLGDVAADLVHIIDGSTVAVDGISASAEPHPAFDPEGAGPGEGCLLVTLTDQEGRRRVVEVEIRAVWREDTCGHEETEVGMLGVECSTCGMVTVPEQVEARCPVCAVPVTDLVTVFGVHAASCSLVMCQCEHVEHERGAGGHPYLGVRAGSRRAQHVGLVCDECADGDLSEYLLSESGGGRS